MVEGSHPNTAPSNANTGASANNNSSRFTCTSSSSAHHHASHAESARIPGPQSLHPGAPVRAGGVGVGAIEVGSGNRISNNSNSTASNDEQYHSLSMAYQTYLRHDEKEQNHWEDVCKSYRQYATFAMAQWANHQYRLHSLPEIQRKVLPRALRVDTEDFHKRATLYKEAAIRNQFCLDCILRHAGMPHSQQVLHTSLGNTGVTPVVSDGQVSKVSSVLKSLARDWSVEGRPERDMAYKPILRQVQTYLPIHTANTVTAPSICVPGAGVGRLALELTALGYAVQGNDFSLHMLLASDFILNGGIATPENPLKISPWLLESRNVHSPNDPLRIVHIPDVDPYSLLQGISRKRTSNTSVSNSSHNSTEDVNASDLTQPNFSMAAGEFASIYSNPRERSKWDAVVCAFFLDTSPSIVECIQIIYGMLKPGGLLINFGPLLYHWSGPAMRPDDKNVSHYHERYSYLDRRYLKSIDLCWEDIRVILYNIGFDILEERTGVQSLYTADRRSMMNMNYRCLSFVAKKRIINGVLGTHHDTHAKHSSSSISQTTESEVPSINNTANTVASVAPSASDSNYFADVADVAADSSLLDNV